MWQQILLYLNTDPHYKRDRIIFKDRGPLVYQKFCYVLPSLNKVVTYLLIASPTFVTQSPLQRHIRNGGHSEKVVNVVESVFQEIKPNLPRKINLSCQKNTFDKILCILQLSRKNKIANL